MDEPTSAEWVIGEWVTVDRELHPFEVLELATVIEAVKLHVLHGWPRWWGWTFASLGTSGVNSRSWKTYVLYSFKRFRRC